MTVDDYKLLINICQQCLRSASLSIEQTIDIDTMINKLYQEMQSTKEQSDICYGRKLKVGVKKTALKQTGLKSKMKKIPTTTHGSK